MGTLVEAAQRDVVRVAALHKEIKWALSREAQATAAELQAELKRGAVWRLLESGSVPVDELDERGQTALMEASKRGCKATATLLLERGAKIDLVC